METEKQNETLTNIKEYFESNMEYFLSSMIKDKIVNIDFKHLSEELPDVADLLIERPEETIQSLEIALEETTWTPKDTKVRFVSLSKSQDIPIREIRSKHLGRMISIEGTIRQASEVRPLLINAKFECPSCGTIISILQSGKKYKEPIKCSCGRRGGFKELCKDMVDSQNIVVEEPYENLENSSQPKKINVSLIEDLTEPKMEKRTTPGSRVLVIGILKEVERVKYGSKELIHEIIIEANNIIPLEDNLEDSNISEENEKQILELSKNNPLDKIVSSFAPSIYGYENIKKAIVLQLFGGNRVVRSDGTRRRGNLHCLILGDPGLAKSTLLKYATEFSPKARFVSGKGTSGVGISASVIRDELTGDWSLQAGALVLANNGILALDEMDKMSEEDRSNLHEAMSIETLTIAKANIQACLQTRTAILAAGNPKYSRFNHTQPIIKQINLSPTLLNRFDCIFILKDIPNEDMDDKIAKSILSDELKEGSKLDNSFIRKYISYAKKNIRPKMTKNASLKIREFYVGLRKDYKDQAEISIPIGARQLESLVRIAEASAKCRLSKSIDLEDAELSINVMLDYLSEVGLDKETGKFDMDVLSGTSSSERGKMKSILDYVKKQSVLKETRRVSYEELVEYFQDKINLNSLDNTLSKLNSQGDLIKTKDGYMSI